SLVYAPRFSWKNVGWEQADDHPVVNVSWNDAVAFCDWLSKKEGKKYELPTEAEWEYACRAGKTTRFQTGADPESLVGSANLPDASAAGQFPAWTTVRGDDGFVFTAPVGKFKPNAWGLYDMAGNVWEWCTDSYAAYPAGPVTDPRPDEDGADRVLRG